MIRHRLAPEADYYRLPEPPAPTIHPGSFLLCSPALLPICTLDQWTGLQRVYGYAFEQAHAITRPSILDRDWFTFWN